MNPSALKRHLSAYWFTVIITLILCGLAAGILYIDNSANATIASADGLLRPMEESLLSWAEHLLLVESGTSACFSCFL